MRASAASAWWQPTSPLPGTPSEPSQAGQAGQTEDPDRSLAVDPDEDDARRTLQDWPVGVPSWCWVCDRYVEHDVSDFEEDGAHAACYQKAQRIDNGFRRARAVNTLIGTSQPVDWQTARW